MKISNTLRRSFFLAFSLVIVIGLLVSFFLGKSQDKSFLKDAQQYNEVLSAFQEGEYELSYEKSRELEIRQGKSEILNYINALSYANTNNPEQAIKYFNHVLDLNPYKVEDSMFMLQFAELLIEAEQFDEAHIVLARCDNLPIPEIFPQYKERVAQLWEQLSNQS
ncbi:tetratricopeptide repeat protein [Sporosarcina koreensis]|uniref:tetratricopeptide repeat protein n=1 Tax=Sporosarcina koreensis TaxID=334735 RepID=UPI00075B89C5|nr:tetratricopeptide repeat protein [Sporosarcina koreensis]